MIRVYIRLDFFIKSENTPFPSSPRVLGSAQRETMSSSLLEARRAKHEHVEQLERLIVTYLRIQPLSVGLLHRVRNMAEKIMETANELVLDYQDKDNAMIDENNAMKDGVAFYNRIKEITEYHRKHPAAGYIDSTDCYERMLEKNKEPVIHFSVEEDSGQFLDLHDLHKVYMNSKFGRKLSYFDYLDEFSKVGRIPSKLKLDRKYKEYVQQLLEYLTDFLKRTKPLLELERIFAKVVKEFEELWNNGLILGWQNENNEYGDAKQPEALIDLDDYSTVEELMDIGLGKLKEALSGRGLKAGGTLQQRAERLFLTKHTPLEKLDRKHFVKISRGPSEHAKEIALMVAKTKKVCELLHETIELTKENSKKKCALTHDEIVQNGENDEIQSESESDSNSVDQQDNPLNLYLDRNGNPIPHWLYKLYRLDETFTCEICGNHRYQGPWAYQHHFTEFRHRRGMKMLGIKNSKAFYEITSKEDAIRLWEKIQKDKAERSWDPELEEFEDAQGNIFTKKDKDRDRVRYE